MANDQQNPTPDPRGRFQRWLQLVEAHAAQKKQREAAGQEQGPVGKPRCVHGEPWDECETCKATTGEA